MINLFAQQIGVKSSVIKIRTSEDIVASVAEGSGSIPPSPVKLIDELINLPPSPVKRTKRKSLVNHIDDSTLIGRYFQIKEVKRTSESLKLSVVEGVEGSSTSIKEVRDYRPSAFDMYVRIREPNIFYGTSDEDGSYVLRLQQVVPQRYRQTIDFSLGP